MCPTIAASRPCFQYKYPKAMPAIPFKTNARTTRIGVSGVTAVCEYLSDQGLIGKVAMPTRLTKKSSADVQELAFYAVRSK